VAISLSILEDMELVEW
jgi:hypothetical protein